MIIFIWARSFIGEQIEKFGEPVDRVCDRVNFDVEIFNDDLGYKEGEFVNLGDVPIYNFEIKSFNIFFAESKLFTFIKRIRIFLASANPET